MRLDPLTRRLVRLALEEDLGRPLRLPKAPARTGERRTTCARAGDITSKRFLPEGLRLRGRFVVKGGGVLCGTKAAAEVFRLAAPGSRLRWLRKDGARVRAGTVVGAVFGGRGILSAERTALNFLQRLSGIATLTRAYVDRTRGTRARIYDTRKTAPGFRSLDKLAVRCGGGRNHRFGLYDMVMLKDNHLAALSPRELARRLAAFRRRRPGVPVEFEATTHGEVRSAADLGADVVMLDNMGPSALRREIRWLRRRFPRIEIEVSGGVSLKDVRRLALLGPDRISVGRITHSAPALDISLEIDKL